MKSSTHCFSVETHRLVNFQIIISVPLIILSKAKIFTDYNAKIKTKNEHFKSLVFTEWISLKHPSLIFGCTDVNYFVIIKDDISMNSCK